MAKPVDNRHLRAAACREFVRAMWRQHPDVVLELGQCSYVEDVSVAEEASFWRRHADALRPAREWAVRHHLLTEWILTWAWWMVIDFPLYAVKIKISRAGDYMGGVWGSPRSLRTIQLLPGEVLVDDPDFLTPEIWQRRLVEAGFQPGDVVFDDLNFPAPNFLTPEIYQRRLVERLAEAAEKSVFWLDGFTRLTLADTDLNALEKVDAYLSAFGDVIKGPRPSESAVDYAARAEQAWQAAAVARRGKTSAAKPRLREHSDWTARYYLTEARPAEIAEAAGRTLKAVEKAIAEIRSPANFRSDVRLTGPDNTYRLN